jgi:hypothetical protein
MSHATLTLESLFGDLDLELDGPDFALPPPPAGPGTTLPAYFARDAETTLDLFGFTSASDLLSDGDTLARPTRPYDIPEGEFAQAVTMWGDDERFSALNTAPVVLDELPEDAYPTVFTPLELE